jgi:transcriptional regulator with XRE-family HTH domain
MEVNRLRELREEAILTVRELADRSGVSEDTITKLEHGQRSARPSTIRKLAKALDVEPQELRRAPEPAAPLTDAPRGAGRPLIIDIAWDAARRQVALEKRGDEIAGTENIIDQRHENEAARRLREEHGLDGNDAEAVVDFALERARLEEKNTILEEENTMLRDRLQERERAHS